MAEQPTARWKLCEYQITPLHPQDSACDRLAAAHEALASAERRLHALEELAAELAKPLDLTHAHDLWQRIQHAPAILSKSELRRKPVTLEEELASARETFTHLREDLVAAEERLLAA